MRITVVRALLFPTLLPIAQGVFKFLHSDAKCLAEFDKQAVKRRGSVINPEQEPCTSKRAGSSSQVHRAGLYPSEAQSSNHAQIVKACRPAKPGYGTHGLVEIIECLLGIAIRSGSCQLDEFRVSPRRTHPPNIILDRLASSVVRERIKALELPVIPEPAVTRL